jgi:2-keto-4-pentenoate hydratase/2-oxohepta-3-ene-1,7-dioic acid hydratase in catechol pathway
VKLATFIPPGGESALAGVVDGDTATAFGDGRAVVDVLAERADAVADGPSWALADVALQAPVPEPPTIYAIGLNYARHVAETGATAPEQPVVFVKVRGSAAPPSGPVVCPAVVRRLDYEGELAIVIGAGGRPAGYCVADDVSARDLQRREPHWIRAKGADTFCPFGPWVTTADEVADPGSLRLRTWVNGELRQDSSTSDMIFDCDRIVAFIAETCTLVPGDLILTGTPNGVGMGMDPPRFLAAGDVVRIEIESLGAIEHPVASAT